MRSQISQGLQKLQASLSQSQIDNDTLEFCTTQSLGGGAGITTGVYIYGKFLHLLTQEFNGSIIAAH